MSPPMEAHLATHDLFGRELHRKSSQDVGISYGAGYTSGDGFVVPSGAQPVQHNQQYFAVPPQHSYHNHSYYSEQHYSSTSSTRASPRDLPSLPEHPSARITDRGAVVFNQHLLPDPDDEAGHSAPSPLPRLGDETPDLIDYEAHLEMSAVPAAPVQQQRSLPVAGKASERSFQSYAAPPVVRVVDPGPLLIDRRSGETRHRGSFVDVKTGSAGMAPLAVPAPATTAPVSARGGGGGRGTESLWEVTSFTGNELISLTPSYPASWPPLQTPMLPAGRMGSLHPALARLGTQSVASDSGSITPPCSARVQHFPQRGVAPLEHHPAPRQNPLMQTASDGSLPLTWCPANVASSAIAEEPPHPQRTPAHGQRSLGQFSGAPGDSPPSGVLHFPQRGATPMEHNPAPRQFLQMHSVSADSFPMRWHPHHQHLPATGERLLEPPHPPCGVLQLPSSPLVASPQVDSAGVLSGLAVLVEVLAQLGSTEAGAAQARSFVERSYSAAPVVASRELPPMETQNCNEDVTMWKHHAEHAELQLQTQAIWKARFEQLSVEKDVAQEDARRLRSSAYDLEQEMSVLKLKLQTAHDERARMVELAAEEQRALVLEAEKVNNAMNNYDNQIASVHEQLKHTQEELNQLTLDKQHLKRANSSREVAEKDVRASLGTERQEAQLLRSQLQQCEEERDQLQQQMGQIHDRSYSASMLLDQESVEDPYSGAIESLGASRSVDIKTRTWTSTTERLSTARSQQLAIKHPDTLDLASDDSSNQSSIVDLGLRNLGAQRHTTFAPASKFPIDLMAIDSPPPGRPADGALGRRSAPPTLDSQRTVAVDLTAF